MGIRRWKQEYPGCSFKREEEARLVFLNALTGSKGVYMYNGIYVGGAVVVKADESHVSSRVITWTDETYGKEHLFVLAGIIQQKVIRNEKNELWVIVQHLGKVRIEYKVSSAHVTITKLDKNVRLVAMQHAFTEDCTFKRFKLRVRHELESIDGGV